MAHLAERGILSVIPRIHYQTGPLAGCLARGLDPGLLRKPRGFTRKSLKNRSPGHGLGPVPGAILGSHFGPILGHFGPKTWENLILSLRGPSQRGSQIWPKMAILGHIWDPFLAIFGRIWAKTPVFHHIEPGRAISGPGAPWGPQGAKNGQNRPNLRFKDSGILKGAKL